MAGMVRGAAEDKRGKRLSTTKTCGTQVPARGVGPPKRKSIQNCNILQVHGTMQKCNNLIFVGFVRTPHGPPKFLHHMLQVYIVGRPLFWGAMGVREGEKNAGLAISECRV